MIPPIKLLILLYSILLSLGCKSQPIIIYQGNNQALYISNLTNKSWKKLTDEAFGQFVGYAFNKDTLKTYFEYHGKLNTKFFIDSIFSFIPTKKTVNYNDSLLRHLFGNEIPEYISYSSDGKRIVFGAERYAMFNSWSRVYEINIETGQRIFIDKGKYPLYSADDHYILYTSYYFSTPKIYDRQNNKQIEFSAVRAFWLYK